ncbi:class I SAM-dependent methyltransferase [Hyphococcus flavus]|uniref:Class I SAM-dependent methyltransferase n=1 Tax=Hyphococcus flavus TaxID=1866326 RepID=A0AAE9ZC22_9PROT|nr:class I SAM-dependent methyltransferase [Hyphococcus flavus]WDI30067.1 class I SAM-dependent methyltransferase [Hyphococcus flavus]
MKKITHCRACGSKALTPAFSMVFGGEPKLFSRKQQQSSDYVLCDPSRDARACGLLQSSVADAQASFIPSARHSSTRDHLRSVATEALEMISGRDCSALDIGCNDGTLLSFYPRWVDRFGVDPSDYIEEIGDWAWTGKSVFPSEELDAAFGDKRFDIITAVSVFEHIDDPKSLLKRVKSLLTNDGVFVLETVYAPVALTRTCVETLQANISAVYSLSVIEWMLRDAGLKAFKGSITGKEGGSIRLFITHAGFDEYDFDPWFERLAQLWDEENALAMRALQPYQSFEQRAGEVQRDFIEILEDIQSRGECIHVLGAEPQTEAMLRWAGPAAKAVTAAVDTGAAREAERLGENGPRIISETECRAAEPDFLLASARYKREMMERWRESIMLGAKMIFITPTPLVITAANFASEYGKAINAGDGPAGTQSLRTILAAAGGPRLIADNPDIAKNAG